MIGRGREIADKLLGILKEAITLLKMFLLIFLGNLLKSPGFHFDLRTASLASSFFIFNPSSKEKERKAVFKHMISRVLQFAL